MDQAPIASDSESEPLLCQPPKVSKPKPVHFIHERLFYVNCLPRKLCVPSKPAILILFWTVVVSAIYALVTESVGYAAQILSHKIHIIPHADSVDLNEKVFFSYSGFALGSIFYPLAGFVADVCIGRYRAVIFSLLILVSAFLFLSINSVLYFTRIVVTNSQGYVVKNPIAFFLFGVVGLFFSVIGLAGYQANYIQFGLDQLLEAPSEYQGLFVHWVQWLTVLGYTFVEVVFAWYSCENRVRSKDTILTLPMVFLLALTLLLVITYSKRNLFYSRNVRHNPYKVVFKVLNFARKHKYPLRQSAFTYCDDEYVSRIDFAKERHGGPFTTEQVEDVKTFMRMLIVLVVLGPVFVFDVPTNAVFTVFAQHFTVNRISNITNCTLTWAMLDSGALKYVTALLFFAVYIWLVYSLLRNCIPKIFIRLWIAHFVFVVGAVSMLLIDVIGHLVYFNQEHEGAVCMFYSKVQSSPEMELGLHWSVLILPNILMGIAPVLVMTNAFEFISAQSPHSMTGLFIGLFLAIRGLFQFISSVVLYPFFSLDAFWNHNQPVLTCGFGYLLFTCLVGLLSLISLTVVARRYKYRQRDDAPYNRMYADRVFEDYVTS